jgi:hypothetical protein
VQTEGRSKLNESIQFDFCEFVGPKIKVTEVIPNQKLVWEYKASEHGWVGHILKLELDENDGKTRVWFSHNGWTEQRDFYAVCSFAWGRDMGSLRQYCQTGIGEAHGSAGYRK